MLTESFGIRFLTRESSIFIGMRKSLKHILN